MGIIGLRLTHHLSLASVYPGRATHWNTQILLGMECGRSPAVTSQLTKPSPRRRTGSQPHSGLWQPYFTLGSHPHGQTLFYQVESQPSISQSDSLSEGHASGIQSLLLSDWGDGNSLGQPSGWKNQRKPICTEKIKNELDDQRNTNKTPTGERFKGCNPFSIALHVSNPVADKVLDFLPFGSIIYPYNL